MFPLQIEHVSKQYGDKTAVNEIDIQVKENEIFGLLVANGAGKTTTMRMVLGLIYPDSGRIQWKGKGYREMQQSAVYPLMTALLPAKVVASDHHPDERRPDDGRQEP
jgi:ABC-type uncharacterized transport system ATPase subunit